MVWTIPYTFVAGTKARANEVNENFTSLKQFVDQLEVNEANNEINIANLESNKANLNGSNTELFNVADATSDYNAVNMRTLTERTLNSKGVISGFELSIFNDTTITATAGSCYDSTFTQMINSTTSLQASEDSLGISTKYYIYVCSQSSTGQCQLVLSLDDTTPTVPQGYNYFRRLGYLETDSAGHIDTVNKDGTVTINTVGFIGPNLGNASGTTILTENRWLYVRVSARNTAASVAINGQEVCSEFTAKEWNDAHSALIPCMKGQTVTVSGGWSTALWKRMI